MALFTISDLHLSFGKEKPMDIFGGNWVNYQTRLYESWQATVAPTDLVVLPGDLCWGMSLSESLPDFQFLHSLNGKKLLLKGNHDYYWTTMKKMQDFLFENELTSIDFLHNDAILYEGVSITGTRGWFYEEEKGTPDDEKIFKRELLRLETSLKAGQALGGELITFLHYPPIFGNYRCTQILALLFEYGVKKCIYGHLHGASRNLAFEGKSGGISYYLVSADHLDFTPEKIT